MFAKLLVLAVFAAVALAAPAEKDVVAIVAQDMDVGPDGKFRWSFESADGTKAQQTGDVRVVDKDTAVGVMQGSFEYRDLDGTVFTVTYVADENGYQPQGAHLPVAPEIPAPIAKALAYLATAPPPKEK